MSNSTKTEKDPKASVGIEKDTAQNRNKLGSMIKGIKVAMMSTSDSSGTIRSRPMGTIDTHLGENFDGQLWFFTREPSGKVEEIKKDQHVNLSFSSPEKQIYISVVGRGTVIHDKEKMKELWNPIMKAWFPEGLEDPELALIRVTAESAEIWDSPPGLVVHLVGFVEAIAKGESYDQIHGKDQHKILDLNTRH